MNKIKRRQIEIVKELVKSPKVILKEMTKFKCTILHPTWGIVGEVFEIFAAIRNNDIPNLTEELGDLMFYLIDFRLVIGYNDLKNKSILAEEERNLDSVLQILEEATAELHDLVKKLVVYNKKISNDILYDQIVRIEISVAYIMDFHDLVEDEVRQANIDKLRDGPSARYPKGYSDDAAQKRNDKN